MNNDIPKWQGYVIFNGSDSKWCSDLEHLIYEEHIIDLWHAKSEQDFNDIQYWGAPFGN